MLTLFGLLSVLWIFLAPHLSNRFCPCEKSSGAAAATAFVVGNENSDNVLLISDSEYGFQASASEGLIFPVGICAFLMPLPEGVEQAFQALFTHLKTNPDRILVIRGCYFPKENNSCTNDPDLGLARAKVMRNHLEAMGIDAKQIRMDSKSRNLKIVDGAVLNGLSFSFMNADGASVEKRLRKEKVILYFEKNEMDIQLDAQQQNYLSDLKLYLAQNPKAKVLVSGHTDDKGKDAWNRRLSRKRAQVVADFMKKNGISSRNIIIRAYGPDYPIAPNDTESNREKNRRVEVTIK